MKHKSNKRGYISHIALHTSQKGITLIALVITIIVLLILVGITISMVLGENGIISQAQTAKETTERATLKENIKTAKAAAALAIQSKQEGLKIASEEIANINTGVGINTGEMSSIKDRIEEFNNMMVDKYEYKNSIAEVTNDGVPIPVGFAHVKGTTKEDGLIIVDGEGNEFVWIPVEDTYLSTEDADEGIFAHYGAKLYNQYWAVGRTWEWKNGALSAKRDVYYNEPGSYESAEGININKLNNIENWADYKNEFYEMAKSMEIYKGFYVGRYETSFNENKVASVSNVVPYNNENWYTFYNKQKELYSKESNSGVVSGMIYGCQWYAMMNWMKDISNITYNARGRKIVRPFIIGSTDRGWKYSNSIIGNPQHLTGLDLNGGENIVKNIYDLAGNYSEWTQEDYLDFSQYPYKTKKVVRSGSFKYEYDEEWEEYEEYFYNAGERVGSFLTETVSEDFSSRLQLYIK